MDIKKDEILKRQSKLSPQKQEIFKKRLQGEVDSHFQLKVIPRRSQISPAPLSFAQQRLWFLDRLQPNQCIYNNPYAVRLNGLLNVAALTQSLNEIVQRHEVLRTTFIMVEGQPVQVIAPALTLGQPVVNVDQLSPDKQQAEVRRVITEEAQHPFNLAEGPLVRVTLLQLGEAEHIMLFTIHHIVFDGWSFGVIIREVVALYEAFNKGQPSPLPKLSIQYADFAIWQRQWLQGDVLEAQLSYWKQQLHGPLPMLQLPTDRSRSAVQSFRGATQVFYLSPDLTESLKALSRQEGVTLFMILLSAFKTLLYRYTGQDDISLGSPIANRNRGETEKLIGFFVNTLVLRTYLGGNPTFRDLLKRVKQMALEAYAHEDLPFDVLVETLQPKYSLSQNPLFQVMIALQNTPMPALKLPELSLSAVEVDIQTAKLDLILEMTQIEQGSILQEWKYNTDLFEAETIKRMAEHWQTLLEGIVVHPDQHLSDLPMLTPTEQNKLLVEWNNTQTDYSQDKCIHQLFEAQVKRSPDAVAVVFEDQHLTYWELNARANQLAQRLQTLGVKPEVLVGICVERSVEMVVGLLGILKAGGAYLPLDPAYPQERLAFILKDAQVQVLVTQQHLVAELPKHDAQVLCLDSDWLVSAQEGANTHLNQVQPDYLAYVIYTSGSTGKPKGVLVTHSNVVRLFESTRSWFDFAQTDVWSLFHSYAFDFSVWELWGALLHGGRLVVVSYWMSRTPETFYKLLCLEQITVLNQTPSAFRQLIGFEEASRSAEELKSLRFVIFGGEALKLQSLKPWFDRHGDQFPQLVNMYGITETTVHVTHYPLTISDLRNIASVIGRPIPDLQVYLLDQHQQLVATGVPGEMYIGGDGVARGYLNRPELTAERFIANPFSDKPGKRLYKTGDLARYLANGNIEYLGRIDHQVKVRGFRIELSEIEAVLSQHPAVLQNVVIVREDSPGDQRLVAYFVAKQESTPTLNDLRRFLKQQLPEYMIPSAWVLLEVLPLTANGKVDHRALPEPEQTRPELEQTFVAPRTPIEEVLAGIWTQTLDTSSVGIHDNFFDLGGHSLLATQVIACVRKVFQIELPLRQIFDSPTVAGLAEHLEQGIRAGHKLETLPIKHVSQNANPPLSFAQQRLWFLNQLEPHSSSFNMPAAVRLSGKLNVTALVQSFNEIVSRHAALRTKFILKSGQPIQYVAPSLSLAIPVVDLLLLNGIEQEAEIKRLATHEAHQPFDLATGPLVRVTLLLLAETEHVVLLTMHHIVSDGWSMGIFIRELAILYKAFLSGKPSPLPELPIQYVDFAVWQRQWLQAEVLEQQLTYWKRQLAGSPVLQLPIDHPRPVTRTFRNAIQSFSLSNNLTEGLKTLSRQEGVTLFMTLLAGFLTVLYRLCGQDDIVVGTNVANRTHAETEGLIGFFINHIILRTNLSGYPSFQELLKRVREVALGGYAHQDLPFEKLVEALQPERKTSDTLLFQVLFVLQNFPMSKLELPDLSMHPIEITHKTGMYDLALFLTETEQGIVGIWNYNADLFKNTTIIRLSKYFEALLGNVLAQPNIRLNNIEMLTEAENKKQMMEQVKHESGKLNKFKHLKPKSVKLPQGQLIRTDNLHPGETLPLVITPDVGELDLIDWAQSNRAFLETKLLDHGAILLRGFNLNSVLAFENLAKVICPDLFAEYGDLPRVGVSGKVYASTPYPQDKAILFHNESSHMHCWPRKIWFFCVQPTKIGGETPIVDCRRVYQLLDPELRSRFEQKQLMYVRNYTPGLDVSWQDFFHTTDKTVVEDYCRTAGINFEWRSGDSLLTRKIKPASIKHPITGEMVFFNQLFLHHISCLEPAVRASLLSMFGYENLPRHVYYGDGFPIEEEVIEQIAAIYQQVKVSFPWQQGDILMLDNMLIAHGRNPYEGPRQIVVAMGEMIQQEFVN